MPAEHFDPFAPVTDADRKMFEKLVSADMSWDVAFGHLLAARAEAYARWLASTDAGRLVAEGRRLLGAMVRPQPATVTRGAFTRIGERINVAFGTGAVCVQCARIEGDESRFLLLSPANPGAIGKGDECGRDDEADRTPLLPADQRCAVALHFPALASARVVRDAMQEIVDEMDALAAESAARESAVTNRARADKLQAFKDYVHKRLDDAGVPVDPPSSHREAGCRIGGRLDIVLAAEQRAAKAEAALAETQSPSAEWGRRAHEVMLACLTQYEHCPTCVRNKADCDRDSCDCWRARLSAVVRAWPGDAPATGVADVPASVQPVAVDNGQPTLRELLLPEGALVEVTVSGKLARTHDDRRRQYVVLDHAAEHAGFLAVNTCALAARTDARFRRIAQPAPVTVDPAGQEGDRE